MWATGHGMVDIFVYYYFTVYYAVQNQWNVTHTI